jgi:hypothetical protein
MIKNTPALTNLLGPREKGKKKKEKRRKPYYLSRINQS